MGTQTEIPQEANKVSKVEKKEHPTVALKMLAQKAKALERAGLIDQADVEAILAIHQKAAIKFMQG